MLDGQADQVRDQGREKFKIEPAHNHKQDNHDATGHAGQITSQQLSQSHRNLAIDNKQISSDNDNRQRLGGAYGVIIFAQSP